MAVAVAGVYVATLCCDADASRHYLSGQAEAGMAVTCSEIMDVVQVLLLGGGACPGVDGGCQGEPHRGTLSWRWSASLKREQIPVPQHKHYSVSLGRSSD